MAEGKSKSLIWDVALYGASLLVVLQTYRGVEEFKVFTPILFLIPMLLLLLPVLRNKIQQKIRFLPGPGWSLGLAVVLMVFQGVSFGEGAEAARLAKDAQRNKDSRARVAQQKKDREAEYQLNKIKILAEVEQQLASNQSREALATISKYMTATSDPDLGRLRGRAELQVMKLDLQNEASLSPERRVQIYKAMMDEEPGNRAQYQRKLKEAEEVLAIAEKVKEASAKRAALEANVKSQFSAYDGSHRNVEASIKGAMRNPRSYEHVETRYLVNPDSITVFTTYRGTNAFNAIVTNTVVATVDANGNVLSLQNR
ncbi:hypothetical protein LC612_36125 [Nostoc sp. CHAB 5834]|nr:hypothetical protein [Nostoc sp. CHAB 5834]